MNRSLTSTFPDTGLTVHAYNDSTAPLWIETKTKRDASGDNIVSYVRYDGIGRVWRSEHCVDGSDACTSSIKTDTTFDHDGRVSTVSNPYYTTGDSTYGVTTNIYDELSRVKQVILQDGATVSTAYSNNCTTITDAAGKARISCSDALGRMIQVVEPNPSTGSLTSGTYPTYYSYDVLGNLLCVEQHGDQTSSSVTCSGPTDNTFGGIYRVRKFHYDSLSRLLESRNPEAGIISYVYDANSNVTSKTAPAANQTGSVTFTTSMTYDALNRLVEKDAPNSSSPSMYYYYDGPTFWGMTMANPIGRLVASESYYPTTTGPNAGLVNAIAYHYDAMGRTAWGLECRWSTTMTEFCNNTHYVYNPDGSTLSVTYPNSGTTVNYGYDGAGRLQCAGSAISGNTCTGTIYKSVSDFWPHGSPNTGLVGVTGAYTGNTDSATYNNRLQLTHLLAATAGTTNIQNIWFGHNEGTTNNGNVVWTENLRDENRSTSNYYDSLNRLTASGKAVWVSNDCATNYYQNASLPKQWAQGFNYDAWGNLLAISVLQCSTPTFASSANQANQLNAVTGMSHDAAGNVMSDGANAYVFDAENRISSAAGVIYSYDANGMRASKSSGKQFIHGIGSTVIQETDSSGNPSTEYIYFGGERIARRDISDNSLHYFWTDQIGSSSTITSATGAIEEESDFYPFGGERQYTMNASVANTYKFTGKERDAESGLDYFGARFLNSSMGRWMSPDWGERPMTIPYAHIDDPQTLNLYSYVRNNPITGIDADGHQFVGTDGKKVVVTETNGKINVSKNASKDLKRMTKLVSKSGSKTAVSQFLKLANNNTKVNFKIEKDVVKNGKYGLHQVHNKDGNILNWKPNENNNKVGRFEGDVAFTTGASGNPEYKEATITIFEGNMVGSKDSREEYMVSVFGHEAFHDTDQKTINSIKQSSESHGQTDDVESPANAEQEKIISEMSKRPR